MRILFFLFWGPLVCPQFAAASGPPPVAGQCANLFVDGHTGHDRLVLAFLPSVGDENFLSYGMVGTLPAAQGAHPLPFVIQQPREKTVPGKPVSAAARVSERSQRGIVLLVDEQNQLWLVPAGQGEPILIHLDVEEEKILAVQKLPDSVNDSKRNAYGTPFTWAIATNRRIFRWTFNEVDDSALSFDQPGLHESYSTVRNKQTQVVYRSIKQLFLSGLQSTKARLPILSGDTHLGDCHYIIGRLEEDVVFRDEAGQPESRSFQHFLAFKDDYLLASTTAEMWKISGHGELAQSTRFKPKMNGIRAVTGFQHQGLTSLILVDNRGGLYALDAEFPEGIRTYPSPYNYGTQGRKQEITSLLAVVSPVRPKYLTSRNRNGQARSIPNEQNGVMVLLAVTRSGQFAVNERWILNRRDQNGLPQAAGPLVRTDREEDWMLMPLSSPTSAGKHPVWNAESHFTVPVIDKDIPKNTYSKKADLLMQLAQSKSGVLLDPRLSAFHELAHRFNSYASYADHQSLNLAFNQMGASQEGRLFILESLSQKDREDFLNLEERIQGDMELLLKIQIRAQFLASHITALPTFVQEPAAHAIFQSLAHSLHFSENELIQKFIRWSNEVYSANHTHYPANRVDGHLASFLKKFIFDGHFLELGEPEEPSPI